MDRVEEIEAAINSLPDEDLRRIARWFRDRDQTLWDQQLNEDSTAGKLDFLFDEAEIERSEGFLRDWPASH